MARRKSRKSKEQNKRNQLEQNRKQVLQNEGLKKNQSESEDLIIKENQCAINKLQEELAYLMAKGIAVVAIDNLEQCRVKLQKCYEKIILSNPQYCLEKNTEDNLKMMFCQIVESIKKAIEERENEAVELKKCLINVLDQGIAFYKNLQKKRNDIFGFQMFNAWDMHSTGYVSLDACVLISNEKLLVSLGDLNMMKEKITKPMRYTSARRWYIRARTLFPRSGQVYSQCAVIGQLQKRKLEEAYYYMRSLSTKNPNLTAREGLLSMFERVQKWYYAFNEREKCISDAHKDIECSSNIDCKTENMKSFSVSKLNKNFINCFLHIHGHFYMRMRTGLEELRRISIQMLTEFHELLYIIPSPMNSKRLLQILEINIFSVANANLGHGINALEISLEMMSLILIRCCSLQDQEMLQLVDEEMTSNIRFKEILLVVKIWTDWMLSIKELWSCTLRTSCEKLGFGNSIWSIFANLLTKLKNIDTSQYEIVYERKKDFEPLALEEDIRLQGFSPLEDVIDGINYIKPPFHKDEAAHFVRIKRIIGFGEHLCNMESPYLRYDMDHRMYLPLTSYENVDSSIVDYDKNQSASQRVRNCS